MRIYGVNRITAGGRHVWLETSIGLVRKPLTREIQQMIDSGKFDQALITREPEHQEKPQKSIWSKFWDKYTILKNKIGNVL